MAPQRIDAYTSAMSLQDHLEPYDWRLTDPEDILDQQDPENDPYFQYKALLEARLAAKEGTITPNWLRVAREAAQDYTTQEIARRLDLKANYVSRARNDPRTQEIITLLRKLARHNAGPSLNQRKHMLYRIAKRTEQQEPNTCIAALREMNRMDGAYVAPTPPPPPAVQITINQETFPTTSLDAPPAPAPVTLDAPAPQKD